MNGRELALALRTMSFLDSHADEPAGVLELRGKPAPRLLVWHPDGIDWIFRSFAQLDHAPSRTLTPVLGARSLLWMHGPRHAAYRQVLGPPLRGKSLRGYHDIISEATHSAIDTLAEGDVIALPEWTRKLTLRIIGRILLGEGHDAVLATLTGWLERALGSRSRTLAYRYLRGGLPASGEVFDRILTGAARSTVDNEPPPLASFLQDSDGPLGGLDDEELRDQLVSLLFAGHETTASAAAWTLFWLDREDSVRRDVLAELSATTDDGTDANQVPLLQAVIDETLRLSPPAIVAGNRVTTREAEILGRTCPAGTVLTPSIYLAHHRADRFPNPYRFDPTRFLGEHVSAREYFPFGGGNRHCLGSQLAQLELRVITAAVLRRLRLRCVDPRRGVAQMRGHAMAPAGKLRMEVTACLS